MSLEQSCLPFEFIGGVWSFSKKMAKAGKKVKVLLQQVNCFTSIFFGAVPTLNT
jgi:hypothetical protein